MDHINDRADMTIFNGTEFEGMTYMQVRRRLTDSQVNKIKMLNRRNRKVAGLKQAERKLAITYK